ncbi:hypothetical protein K4G96_27030, partial [Mycobacterium tuberculosis]|nr:hypothetical protein [Mycobacterium tuberculosis]
AIIHGKYVVARDFNTFILTAQYQRINLTGARGQESHYAMVSILQLARVCGSAKAFHIAGGDVDADLQIADMACD